MTHSHISTGKLGEEKGAAYLTGLGYNILETNYRTPFGEADIIASMDGFIVVVEIKARRQTRFGFPEEAVGIRKQRKLVRIAQWYLKGKRQLSHPARFDVLSVLISENGVFSFRLFENAFAADINV